MEVTEPKTLQQAVVYFADQDNCLKYLASKRWPKGVICPICESDSVMYLATQRRWKCRKVHAKQQFSVKVGTIFEDSPIGLDKWLMAMWLIVNCKNGISSYEISRALGITQKSAWFLDHRIRMALHGDLLRNCPVMLKRTRLSSARKHATCTKTLGRVASLV